MASRIVCYRLEAKPGPRELSLPMGAETLAATYHNGAVGVWIRLLEKAPPSPGTDKEPVTEPAFEVRVFELVETGKVLTDRHRYLGTCAAPGGTFCMHVLERLEPGDVERHPERTLAQRLEGLEDDLEEIAANLRGRIEGLESPGTHEPEALEDSGEEIARIHNRLEALESAPRVGPW